MTVGMEEGNSLSRSPTPSAGVLANTESCVVTQQTVSITVSVPAEAVMHFSAERSHSICNLYADEAADVRWIKMPVVHAEPAAWRNAFQLGWTEKQYSRREKDKLPWSPVERILMTMKEKVGVSEYKLNNERILQLIAHIAPIVNSPLNASQPSAFTPISNQLTTEMFLPAISPSPPPNASLISKMCYDFTEQKRRRRAMLCNSLEEILSDDCDTALRNIATADDYSRLFQVQMVLMFEWAERLAEFRQLHDPMDKTKLLRAFALRYILLDNVFHTVEMGYTDRYVLVNNNYIIPGHPPPASSALLIDERRVYMLMFGCESQELISELIIPITEMRLTIGEMMALRCIMFWNPGDVGLTHNALTISQEASNVAVQELHKYFEVEDITNIENRIGNMLLLLPSFTKHVSILYETVKLIPTFGKMQEWDSFMDDLLRGV
ncbi:hypothetical protein WR25_23486 [Diploscapter pachys]|uniref:NR LBD domain-containing protein n=1 Tax=Diploscapter pachys TaxID=2018661 RepID=A0A2A2L925_9BILA|nr:hypothetical protein WR25_23486 [Diploscapter pachys]